MLILLFYYVLVFFPLAKISSQWPDIVSFPGSYIFTTCADPESFVRGGANLIFLSF